jgi:hypothetical protein
MFNQQKGEFSMTTYRITNLDAPEEFTDYPDIVAGMRPASLLPVPYFSQVEEGAKMHHNDCGAACGVMLLKAYNKDLAITVDEFYDRCNPVGDVYLSATQIKNTLAAYHLATTWQVGLSLASLLDTLRAEKPLIVLINYGVLVRANLTEKKSFRGAHFTVVVGMDNKYVYTHDPYYAKKNGEACLYPIDKFVEAWGRCGEQSNPNFAALIPSYSVIAAQMPLPEALYRIRVTADVLNIRSGPGVNFLDIGDLKQGTELDIFKEQGNWGEIGSDHWISLDWTAKI